MKKIIALWGTASVGKSSTITQVYEILLKKYPKLIRKIYRADIKIIVVIDGIKVGIESQGDPSSRMPDTLRAFVRAGCRVIVCATRTRGGTVDAVERYSKEYEIVWIEQNVVATQSERPLSNRGMAMKIVAEIEDVIGGK